MRGPFDITWPLGSFPGNTPQESAGRVINCASEPLGPGGPAPAGYHRQPGLSQFAVTAQTGYRGGLIVNNLSYEMWLNEAATVDINANVILLGAFPGSKHVSIARNQNAHPDVVAVDPDNGAYILDTATLANATATATITGSVFIVGDQVSLTFSNTNLAGFPVTVSYTLGSSETVTTIAAGLTALINANATLIAANLTALSALGVITFSQQGSNGNLTTLSSSVTAIGHTAGLVASLNLNPGDNTTATVVPGSGSATVTIGGTIHVGGGTVTLTFTNPASPLFPVSVVRVIVGGESATQIATALVGFINANATLGSVGISASNSGGISPIITVLQPIGNETVTLTTMSGGAGTVGIVFTGAPLAYNGLGRLPQPNSICFQDGYFFFTIADGRCFATAINTLAMNSLTFITAQARSDVTLLRGIAFSGQLFLFTTGSCEVWQDVANVAPAFPYARLVVLPYGLLQANAIAGFETGFDDLSWVAQDFGVWELNYGSLTPTKISPPDLDRLIEVQHRAGNIINAAVYMFAGKKFWVLSSPAWTWEFNLGTQQWNERTSLNSSGLQGRWRGDGGHPAFTKWLLGDTQSGTLCFVDDSNETELGMPMLMRLESAPVANFPNRLRVARADFNFSTGSGQATRAILMMVKGAAAGTGGVVRLTVDSTQQVNTNDTVIVSAVGGTTEANGTWTVTVIDATHIELQGSVFVHAWTSGGTATDVTAPPNVINPMVAISWSDNDGLIWKNPLLRSLGPQGSSKTTRVVVKHTGMSGPQGRRWRLDITDPVNAPFMSATQSDNPAEA
jgi:hypothetical protein